MKGLGNSRGGTEKGMKKKRLITIFFVMVFWVFTAAACGKEKAEEITDRDVVTAFLTAYYTTDYNGRYSEWMTVEATDMEKSLEAMGNYYSVFSELTTEEQLEKMIQNRIPMKYDMLDAEEGIVCEAPEIELTEEEGEAYSYTFTVTRTETVIRTGEIRCSQTDAGYRVTYFYEK